MKKLKFEFLRVFPWKHRTTFNLLKISLCLVYILMGILTGESLGICLGIAQFIVSFQFPEDADKTSEAECLWVLTHEKKVPLD